MMGAVDNEENGGEGVDDDGRETRVHAGEGDEFEESDELYNKEKCKLKCNRRKKKLTRLLGLPRSYRTVCPRRVREMRGVKPCGSAIARRRRDGDGDGDG